MRQSYKWVFLVIKMLTKHSFMKYQCVSKESLWFWNEAVEIQFIPEVLASSLQHLFTL